ncbi:MAG: hypothetical protein HC871_04750 [Rhizobiales bacterium]|nr:hypothetical protein [Hyphomicrobiales bacterium]
MGTTGGLWDRRTRELSIFGLTFTLLGETPRLITRGGAGSGASAGRVTGVPAGHPEGYLEGFSNIYADAAELIAAAAEDRELDSDALLVPGVRDGFDGMAFITAPVESSHRSGVWVEPDRVGCRSTDDQTVTNCFN